MKYAYNSILRGAVRFMAVIAPYMCKSESLTKQRNPQTPGSHTSKTDTYECAAQGIALYTGFMEVNMT